MLFDDVVMNFAVSIFLKILSYCKLFCFLRVQYIKISQDHFLNEFKRNKRYRHWSVNKICLGKISPPSGANSLTFAFGSTGRIMWSFDDDIKSSSYRFWTFTPSDERPQVNLAIIIGDVQILSVTCRSRNRRPQTEFLIFPHISENRI